VIGLIPSIADNYPSAAPFSADSFFAEGDRQHQMPVLPVEDELRFVTKHNSERAAALVHEVLPNLDKATKDAKTERLRQLFELGWGKAAPFDGKRKRGRPITTQGAIRRELGQTRLQQWQQQKLAEIGENKFEAILASLHSQGKRFGKNTILRMGGKLSPDRPRPRERAQTETLQELVSAREYLQSLERKLREVASDEELALLTQSKIHVARALCTLAWTTRPFPFEPCEFRELTREAIGNKQAEAARR
jgi:hypothetical protein